LTRDSSAILLSSFEQTPFLNGEEPGANLTTEDKSYSIIQDFCQKVQDAVTASDDPPPFVSLLLQGSSRFLSKASNKDELQQEQRGCIRQVIGRLIGMRPKANNHSPKKKKNRRNKNDATTENKEQQRMLQLTLKYHGATDICKNIPIHHNNICIAPTLMAMFYPSHYFTRTASSEPLLLVSQQEISSEWGLWSHDVGTSPLAIQSAQLMVSNGTCYKISRLGSSTPTLEQTKVSPANAVLSKTTPTTTTTTCNLPSNQSLDHPPLPAPPSQTQHDRVKSVLISSSSSFLQALGVTNEQGQPKNGIMASKLRQCQKFVEITSRLITTAMEQQQQQHHQSTAATTTTTPNIISTTDMGCGRGYLTFALHSYLMQQYGNRSIEVATKGIDVRHKLVYEISQIAQSLGPDFEGLSFETGSIDSKISSTDDNDHLNSNHDGGMNGHSSTITSTETQFMEEQTAETLQVLIALHACDTATDDALWWGISRQVHVMVVAPCCHKQVRPQLNQYVRRQLPPGEPLLEILRHGIYRERMAETVTDSMRALLLELAHYQVQVFEFIGGEDTSKNVMITAVRKRHPRSKAELEQLQRRLQGLAATYGIQQQQLAMEMGIKLVAHSPSDEPNTGMKPRRL
jgi:hypothetical protein